MSRRPEAARQGSDPLALREAQRRVSPESLSDAANSRSELARPAGLEPATLALEGRCSIQLSYGRARNSL